ncbi:MAG: hypothetical protein ACREDR_42480, partial [Blastocatellia bacterium]
MQKFRAAVSRARFRFARPQGHKKERTTLNFSKIEGCRFTRPFQQYHSEASHENLYFVVNERAG